MIDVQSQRDTRKVPLKKVGVKDVRYPIMVRDKAKGEQNWGFWTEAEPHLDNRKLWWPRGKGLGGSSAINGMIYIRGHARDYDQWRQMGLSGWSYEEVLPYFKRSETHHGGGDAPIRLHDEQRGMHAAVREFGLQLAEVPGDGGLDITVQHGRAEALELTLTAGDLV